MPKLRTTSVTRVIRLTAKFLCLVPVILLLCTSPGFAADVPAAATPGGAAPILNADQLNEPFVYPNTVPVEPEEDAVPIEDPDAPRMLVKGFRLNGVYPHESLGINQRAVELVVREKAQALVAGEAARGFTLSMFESITKSIATFYRERGFFLARAYIPAQKVDDGIVAINVVEGFLDQVVYNGNS